MDVMDQLAWSIFFATIIERLIELFISIRNAKWSLAQGGIEFGRSHYKWMVLMHSLFLLSMVSEFYHFENSVDIYIRIAAMVGAVLCQFLRWWVINTLGYQWNTRVIIVPKMGRVYSGPYRFMNHPNYVVVAMETVLLPLIFGSWRTALLFSGLNALMMVVRIRVENDALRGLVHK